MSDLPPATSSVAAERLRAFQAMPAFSAVMTNITPLILIVLGFVGLFLKLDGVGSSGLIIAGCTLLKGQA